MRHIRIAEQALKAAGQTTQSQQYVCRSCLAQAARRIHTSRRLNVEEPFFKKMRNAIFGGDKERKQQQSVEKSQEDVEIVAEDAKTMELQGTKYEVAAVVDSRENKDYRPAISWDGLERVGGKEWVRKRFDMGEQYTGFRPPEIAPLSNEHWVTLIHHITVEVVALRAAGRDVHDVCNTRVGGSNVDKIANARLVNDHSTGALEVQFQSLQDDRDVLAAIQDSTETQEPGNLRTELITITSAERIEYDDVRIQDPIIKLAIFKRALQLTGKRIPDFQLSTAASFTDLVRAFGTAEKPKKLTQIPQVARLAEELPNVTVHESRRTPVHKEIEVGRWKLIEEELSARDLPIFGSKMKYAKEGVRLHER